MRNRSRLTQTKIERKTPNRTYITPCPISRLAPLACPAMRDCPKDAMRKSSFSAAFVSAFHWS
jgi:hypothetical protein